MAQASGAMAAATKRGLEAIDHDLERTFVDISIVTAQKPCIHRILTQYALSHPEIGYTQGMNYVATTMALKHLGQEELARQRFQEAMLQFAGFWSDGFPLLGFAARLYIELARRHLSLLWNHLTTYGVEPLSYLPSGWLSLFGKWLPLPA